MVKRQSENAIFIFYCSRFYEVYLNSILPLIYNKLTDICVNAQNRNKALTD